MKRYIKPISSVLIFAVIILSATACSADTLKKFGLGILLGQPIPDSDTPDSVNEDYSLALIENENDYCIISGEYTNVDMKYTVTRAYELSQLSDAGLSLNDYSSSDKTQRYFSSDGRLLDSSLALVCIDLEIERLSDVKTPYESKFDPDIYWMPNLYLFSQDYNNNISTALDYCFYLEQTEDITRSDIDKEYIYYSIKKGQTAHAKICFIIDKSNLTAPDIGLYIQQTVSVTDSEPQIKIAYIPITIETRK